MKIVCTFDSGESGYYSEHWKVWVDGYTREAFVVVRRDGKWTMYLNNIFDGEWVHWSDTEYTAEEVKLLALAEFRLNAACRKRWEEMR